MKHLAVFILTLVSLSSATLAQDASTFPLGGKAPNVHHTGDVWLYHASSADETFNYNVAVATFAPGAKLNWHLHPAGQQLIITEGVGYYQERNEEVQIVRKGEVIKCEPNVEHWHAAAPNSEFAYLAITGNKPTKWLDEVTDEYYASLPIPDAETDVQQALMELSKKKWEWMADKDVEKLRTLFHEKAMFVHMGGSWGTQQELGIIEGGGIHYKKADIHEASVNVIGNTAVLLNRITLLAVVGGNEVANPFEVTEVYVNEAGDWKLTGLSFTRLLTRE